MIKILLNSLVCLTLVFLNTNTIFALPSAPTLTVSKSGQLVNLKWTSSSGATGYNLYYADFYNPVAIGSIDMGTATQFSVILPNDSSFYVAVKAYDGTGESDFSNLVSVKGKSSVVDPIAQTFSLIDLEITEDPTLYDTGWATHQFFIFPYLRDIDGDGDSDVILAFGKFAQTRADDVTFYPAIFENLGDGTLIEVEIQGQYAATSNAGELEFADFNQDGRLDVVFAGSGYDGPDVWDGGSYGSQNILLMSNTDGTYTDASYLLVQETEFTHSVTTGDVNNDGYPDIYIGNMTGEPHMLLNNNGESFTDVYLPVLFTEGWTANTVNATSSHLTDIDGDGILEIVLGATGEGNNPNLKQSVIVKLDGNGNFEDTPYIILPEGRFGTTTINLDVQSGDVNGDGRIDLLFTQTDSAPYYESRELQILIQQIDGSFVDETDVRIIGLDTTGNWIKLASFIDFDDDDDLDIVHIANCFDKIEPGESVVLYNDGTGVFTAYTDYGVAINMTEKYHPAYDPELGTFIGVVYNNYLYWDGVPNKDLFTITELEINHP